MTTMSTAPEVLRSTTSLLFQMIDKGEKGYLFGIWQDGSYRLLPLLEHPFPQETTSRLIVCTKALISLMKAGAMEIPPRGVMHHIPLGQPFPGQFADIPVSASDLPEIQLGLQNGGKTGFLSFLRGETKPPEMTFGELGSFGDDTRAKGWGLLMNGLIQAGIFSLPKPDRAYLSPRKLLFPGSELSSSSSKKN